MLTTLLVEDNAFFRKMVRDDLLSRFSAMKVIESSNGEEAFKGLSSYPVDLIFMDIGLEGESGLKLTQRIKSDYADKAVVILSGYDLAEYREAAVRCGANCFIPKDADGMSDRISRIAECFYRAKDGGRSRPGCLLLSQDEKGVD